MVLVLVLVPVVVSWCGAGAGAGRWPRCWLTGAVCDRMRLKGPPHHPPRRHSNGRGPSISGIAIRALATNCPLLKDIRVCGTDADGDSIIALARACDLDSVFIGPCVGINTDVLRTVAENSPLLTTISASRTQIGDGAGWDEAGTALAQRCPRLTTVSVSDCDGLTDQFVIAVAGCSCLEQLSIDSNPSISDAIVEVVVQNTSLKWLSVGNTSVTMGARGYLRAVRPDITLPG